MKNKILILFGHPAFHKSRVNRKLIGAIENTEGITIRKLYELYPDFHINVRREQIIIVEYDIIVWHYPFYWYSMPAILKEYMDLVLEHNFAYGKHGNALAGKITFSAITAGGSKEAYQKKGYNYFTIRQFLAPMKQTASLCKMMYYPPFVVHGTHLHTSEDIIKYANSYKNILLTLRDNNFNHEEILKHEYLNDLITFNE